MFKTGLGDMIQKAQKVRQEMEALKDSLSTRIVEASAGGGMVHVRANGKQEILSIRIEEEIFKRGDQKLVEDLVLSGVNQAIQASHTMVADEMSKLTGELGPLMNQIKGMG